MARERFYPSLTAVFVTCLIVSNIIAVKIGTFGPVALPVAVILFPLSYIFGDVLTEVYGYARARRAIWVGFGCNLLAVAAIWLGGRIAAAPFWTAATYASPGEAQRAYDAILGFTPRLLVASFVAYLAGEFLNSYVLARLKVVTAGRLLWARTISSTLVGQAADSGIFITLAYAGLFRAGEIGGLILAQWLFKSAYEALATPFTYLVVNALKRAEGLDVFDRGTDFSPFKLE